MSEEVKPQESETRVDAIAKVAELRRRLANSEEILIQSDGRLLTPAERGEPATKSSPSPKTTTLKPQRWF